MGQVVTAIRDCGSYRECVGVCLCYCAIDCCAKFNRGHSRKPGRRGSDICHFCGVDSANCQIAVSAEGHRSSGLYFDPSICADNCLDHFGWGWHMAKVDRKRCRFTWRFWAGGCSRIDN